MMCPVCQIDNEEIEIAVHLLSSHEWPHKKVMGWMREQEEKKGEIGMTTQPTHTPTPWHKLVIGNRMAIVANNQNFICDFENRDGTQEEITTDAAFIVRAVNAYGPMVEVIKEFAELPMTCEIEGVHHDEEYDGMIGRARQALALAEEPRS